MKRSLGEKIGQAVMTLFLLLLCLSVIYPFMYMLAISLNVGSDAAKGGVYLWPREFTLDNYKVVLGNSVIRNAYLITILRTIVGTIAGLLVTMLAAYALSYRQLPGRKVMLTYVLITMLFNGGLIPFYIQLYELSLINTFWVYILPSAFSAWNMFVMLKFMQGIPEALIESAELDGATAPKVLYSIIVPLSKPMLAALGLFTGVMHWNDWFAGAFYVSAPGLIPVQTFLQHLLSAEDISVVMGSNNNVELLARGNSLSEITLMSVKMATVMVSAIPILCVYPFLQKYFVKGVLIGSVKG